MTAGNLQQMQKIMALIIFVTKTILGEVILPQRWAYVKLKIKWSFIA